ncbi:MAG: hypothetical protein HRT77_09350 [Halioglobus sp.]|nr:hypothetical protein [Halioglobus sp.]
MLNKDHITGINYPNPFGVYAAALCNSASRYVRILSPQLDPAVFHNEQIANALKSLAKASRQTEVRILVSDTRPLISSGHPLLQLARRTPSNVMIRKLTEHPDWKDETIVIRDLDGVLFKHGNSDHDGFYEPASRAATQHFRELFDTLWRLSVEDPDLRSLNI